MDERKKCKSCYHVVANPIICYICGIASHSNTSCIRRTKHPYFNGQFTECPNATIDERKKCKGCYQVVVNLIICCICGIASHTNPSCMRRALGDFDREIWHPICEIYYLEDRFRELPWQAIACGLAYTGSIGHITTWPEKTRELCQLLAENHKGWINIVQPFRKEAALVKLQIVKITTTKTLFTTVENYDGTYNLRDVLVQLDHAQLSIKITVDVFPAV